MKKLIPLLLIIPLTLINNKNFSQTFTPFTPCPDVSIALVRAGTITDDTNPYYIYTVNTLTGAMTLVPGGPLITTGPDLNIQVNGIGLNRTDGLVYGLTFDGTLNTARLVKFGKNYAIKTYPNLAPPSSFTGLYGYVNASAGDCDRANNYYYPAFTANPGAIPGSLVLDKLFVGKISGLSTLGNGTPTAEYYEIVGLNNLPCTNFINSIVNDPQNHGFKDFVYSPFTNSFYTYITYSAGGANFSGQMAQLIPVAGSSPLQYQMVCTPIVNTFTADISGTLIDNAGNFEVLFTDGKMWKMNTSGSALNYTGVLSLLNSSTGLPNPSTGDLASCGGPASAPAPVKLTSFDATQGNCRITFKWTAVEEVDLSNYELEQSFDGTSFSAVSKVSVNKNNSINNYQVVLPSTGKQAYYRLKANDLDGHFTYSKIISVANTCGSNQSGFIINPNPVSDVLNLNLYGIKENAVMQITIYNGLGSTLKRLNQSVSQGTSSFNINVNNLPGGIYYIKVVDTKNINTYSSKFIKQ